MAGDEIALTAGDELAAAIAGKKNQQQVVNFSNPDNLQLYLYLTEMKADIRDLTIKMDNLPNRVNNLEMARLEVARTAVVTAIAAATLASETAQAAAHLAAAKISTPFTTWIIIALLVVIAGVGVFYLGMMF